MNSITVIGNLTRDAAVRDAGGSKVTGFSIAENKKVRGEETTIFYDCSLWGDRGERIAQYLTKGGQVTVIGELSTREKEGRMYLDIRVQDVSLPARQAGHAKTEDMYRVPTGEFDEIPF